MMQHFALFMTFAAAFLAVTACTGPSATIVAPAKAYLGSKVQLLDESTIMVQVRMNAGSRPAQLRQYALCVAAGYAMVREYSYLQHVRTLIGDAYDPAQANAVYVIKPEKPNGLRKMDARILNEKCTTNNIPRI